jgi:hypothetical protein
MRFIGTVFVGFLLLVLVFGFRDVITDGVHGLRTEEISKTQSAETGAGETTAGVLLGDDLFRDHIAQVISVSSTISETPIPTEYNPDTNTLTVSNLTPDTSRTLTVMFYSERDDKFMQVIGPFMLFLIFGGIIGAIIYGVFTARRR